VHTIAIAESRVVSARGPETTILAKGVVGGSRLCSCMKIDQENITNRLQSPRKVKAVNLEPKRIAVRKK
jgi:hypothetical protein